MAGEAYADHIRELHMREVSCRLMGYTFRTCMVAARDIPLEGTWSRAKTRPRIQVRATQQYHHTLTDVLSYQREQGERVCAD